MSKNIFFAILLFFTAVGMTSCYNCVDCNGCDDPSYDTTDACYGDAKDYYRNRKEWKDDVKSYESLHGCDCR